MDLLAQMGTLYLPGSDNYDMYCGFTCRHVAADLPLLAERLADLARAFAVEHYDLKRVCLPQQLAMVGT